MTRIGRLRRRASWMCGTIVALSASISPAADFRRGDVDGNGAVDITDSLRVLGGLFLGEGDPPCLDAADADDSGAIDLSDPLRLLSYLFLDGPAPEAPVSSCGPDVTMDLLDCVLSPGCPEHSLVTLTGWIVDGVGAPVAGAEVSVGAARGTSAEDGTFVLEVSFASVLHVQASEGDRKAMAVLRLDPEDPAGLVDAGILVLREIPPPPPPPDPGACTTAVGISADRGCGRVLAWGDEHVRFGEYLPESAAFWLSVVSWLQVIPCRDDVVRTGIAAYQSSLDPGIAAILEADLGVSVREVRSLGDLDPHEILLVQPWNPPPASVRDWVEAGGALMTMVAGVGETHPEECDGVNGWTADLGLLYDCAHRAPWGPVTAIGESPAAAGLVPGNAPFVNGRWVTVAPGFDGEVVAHAGPCDPLPVPDCRTPLLSRGTAGADDVPVEVDLVDGRMTSVEAAPADPVELHVIGIYEPSGGEVRVRVDRQASMVLVLSSYAPVHWVVEAGDGADIRLVLVNGYHPQTAEVPGGIPSGIDDLMTTGRWWSHGYGNDCGGGDTPALVAGAEAAAGLPLRSFHGTYRAGSFTFLP